MAKRKDPVPMNAAPPSPASPFTQPPGPPPSWAPPGSGGGANAAFGAPPPPAPKNPFINAQFLWQNGGSLVGVIKGVRSAYGGNSQFQNRGGWFLDVQLADGRDVTARINIGDTRHQKLYAKFGVNLVGQRITLRLTNPGDNTKAPWTVD